MNAYVVDNMLIYFIYSLMYLIVTNIQRHMKLLELDLQDFML